MFVPTRTMHSITNSGEKRAFRRATLTCVRFSWMLYITLQSLGSHPLPVESDTGLHVSFAQQLEHLGYWQLSVFVLLHINDPTLYVDTRCSIELHVCCSSSREKMVREFLHRHVSSDIHLNQDEQALIDKYAVPEKLILATKAQRAEYDKRWTNAVHLWINAKQWRKAHDTYCNYVFHDTLLRGSSDWLFISRRTGESCVAGNYEEAKEVLDSLDHQRANISHWNRRGGFARQYVDLLIHFDRIRHGQVCRCQTRAVSWHPLIFRGRIRSPTVHSPAFSPKSIACAVN